MPWKLDVVATARVLNLITSTAAITPYGYIGYIGLDIIWRGPMAVPLAKASTSSSNVRELRKLWISNTSAIFSSREIRPTHQEKVLHQEKLGGPIDY